MRLLPIYVLMALNGPAYVISSNAQGVGCARRSHEGDRSCDESVSADLARISGAENHPIYSSSESRIQSVGATSSQVDFAAIDINAARRRGARQERKGQRLSVYRLKIPHSDNACRSSRVATTSGQEYECNERKVFHKPSCPFSEV
jgi:ribosomal protein L32